MTDSALDTNVVVYLTSSDERKIAIVKQLLASKPTISIQVLNEFANTARRKLWFTWPEVAEFLTILRGLCDVEPLTLATHERGLRYAQRYKFAIYGALIVAAAADAACQTLFSEDMHHGLKIDGLRIVDPFR